MNKFKFAYIIFSFVVIIFINFPIFYFSVFPKDDLSFLGRRTIESQNTYPYISQIQQAKESGLFYQNLYTGDNQTKILNNPSYLISGFISKILNIDPEPIYQFERLIFSILFLFVLYKFINLLPENKNIKLSTFIAVIIFSGIGNLLSKIDANTPTFLIPQANTFLTLMDSPQFIFAITLALSGFYFFIKFVKENKKKFLIACSILFLILSFEYPFLPPIVSLTILFTSYFSKFGIKKSILITLICSIGLLYLPISLVQNPIFRIWESGSIFVSPTPLQFLVEYLFLAIPAIFGIEEIIRSDEVIYKLILAWTFINFIFIFSPGSIQIKFLQGFEIPLAILASIGIYKIISLTKKSWGKWMIVGWILLIAIPSIYIVISDFSQINSDNKDSYFYNISNPEYEGFNWLKNNTNQNDVILSNWFYGNLIPGDTGRKVYVGHQVLTPNFDSKISDINSFLLEQNVLTGYTFLKTNKISYIFLGNFDSMIKYGFDPQNKSYLKNIYSKNGVTIYKVIPIPNSKDIYMFTKPIGPNE